MFKTFSALFLGIALTLGGLRAGDAIQLNPLTGVTTSAPKAISVSSADPSLARLAQVAFDTHGAFTVSNKGAIYAIKLTPEGANSVRVDLTSGAKSLLSQSVSGSDQKNATLRACDLAVKAITNVNGYFASEIVFVSDRTKSSELYKSDLFFLKVRQLTNHKSQTVSPHCSPDGNKVTYTSFYRTGFADLFLLNISANSIAPLASFEGMNTGGAFDATGSKVAMVLSSPGNQEIFVANADGSNPRRLTNNRSIETSPAWSPDGSRLIFTSDVGGGPQLYTMPISGGAMSRVQTNLSGYCAEADWNPTHPELIVFTAGVSGGFQLAIHNLNTRQSAWLTQGGGDNLEARWLNDGRHVVFTQRTGARQRLCVLDTETHKISALGGAQMGNVSQADTFYR